MTGSDQYYPHGDQAGDRRADQHKVGQIDAGVLTLGVARCRFASSLHTVDHTHAQKTSARMSHPSKAAARPAPTTIGRWRQRAVSAWGFLLYSLFCLSTARLLTETPPKQTKGLDAIFRSVASSAYGTWLLALLACGLLCYGLYCLLEARYRDLAPGR